MVSVVVPVLNEERNIRPFYERMAPVLREAGGDYEIIFSLDPCTDATEERIRELREEDDRVKMIRLSRRFGQPAATMAGLFVARGDACVVIDVDLQDPPELIGEMIARWHEGFDVVYAQRRTRAGETLVKRIVVRPRLPRDPARGRGGDPPEHRGLPAHEPPGGRPGAAGSTRPTASCAGWWRWSGFRQTSVLYDRDPRAGGTSKYNRFFGSLRIGLNGIVGFSRYPLHLISMLGLFCLGVRDAARRWPTCCCSASPSTSPSATRRWSSSSPSSAGIQLLSLGVMGEYVGRIYDEVKRRPVFIIDAAEGLEADELRRPRAPPARPRDGGGRPRRPLSRPPVAILAGGRGTRLGSVSADGAQGDGRGGRPPFLEHQLDALRATASDGWCFWSATWAR